MVQEWDAWGRRHIVGLAPLFFHTDFVSLSQIEGTKTLVMLVDRRIWLNWLQRLKQPDGKWGYGRWRWVLGVLGEGCVSGCIVVGSANDRVLNSGSQSLAEP